MNLSICTIIGSLSSSFKLNSEKCHQLDGQTDKYMLCETNQVTTLDVKAKARNGLSEKGNCSPFTLIIFLALMKYLNTHMQLCATAKV